ncbi:hypothetical protein [Nocardioides jejuensis]|uniref:Uncharacterized protein n=1 Tax=Nocardioides jejuensis TaxID=2502782 RepID=A0A4R1CKA9_9ACTN|nr:hypothetical protein [Nocardioides jejuensis]TCJ30626.1 hypothetical protein EPD65_03435 [Nocardioides jejuensis]
MTSTPAADAATPTVRPMVLIGLGLVIYLLSPGVTSTTKSGDVTLHGWDYLPDWAGWLLIAIGTWAFARKLPSFRLMLGSALVAMLVSAALWVPAWRDEIRGPGADPALLWAVSLPALAWLVLYCLALAGLSRPEPGASFWWKYLAGMNAGAALLPVLVYGGKITQLEGLLAVLGLMGAVGTMVFSFYHSGRAWAVVRRTS